MGLRHPVAHTQCVSESKRKKERVRQLMCVCVLIGCLIVAGHFLQKSPIISSSFAKNDLQLKASYGSYDNLCMCVCVRFARVCMCVCVCVCVRACARACVYARERLRKGYKRESESESANEKESTRDRESKHAQESERARERVRQRKHAGERDSGRERKRERERRVRKRVGISARTCARDRYHRHEYVTHIH